MYIRYGRECHVVMDEKTVKALIQAALIPLSFKIVKLRACMGLYEYTVPGFSLTNEIYKHCECTRIIISSDSPASFKMDFESFRMERPNAWTSVVKVENFLKELPEWRAQLEMYQRDKAAFNANPETFQSRIMSWPSNMAYDLQIKFYTGLITEATQTLDWTDTILRPVMMEIQQQNHMYPHQKLVLASSHHARLGGRSGLASFDEAILKMIADMLDPSDDIEFFGLDREECVRWMAYARIRGLLD